MTSVPPESRRPLARMLCWGSAAAALAWFALGAWMVADAPGDFQGYAMILPALAGR